MSHMNKSCCQLAISFVYYTTQLWRSVNAFLFRRTVAGFEELLEQSINQTMEAKLGFKLNFDEVHEKLPYIENDSLTLREIPLIERDSLN